MGSALVAFITLTIIHVLTVYWHNKDLKKKGLYHLKILRKHYW